MGRHPGQDHHSRERDQADDLCQPCGKQALPEPILMQGPGSGARQLPGLTATIRNNPTMDHQAGATAGEQAAKRPDVDLQTPSPSPPNHAPAPPGPNHPPGPHHYHSRRRRQTDRGWRSTCSTCTPPYMRAPDPANDDKPTLGPLDRPQRNTQTLPQSNTSTGTLARRSQAGPGQRRCPGGVGKGPLAWGPQ